MAKYCDTECKETGGICDFCIYYRDDLEDAKGRFAGEGLCEKKDIRVDACDGCEDDFHCSLIQEGEKNE